MGGLAEQLAELSLVELLVVGGGGTRITDLGLLRF